MISDLFSHLMVGHVLGFNPLALLIQSVLISVTSKIIGRGLESVNKNLKQGVRQKMKTKIDNLEMHLQLRRRLPRAGLSLLSRTVAKIEILYIGVHYELW